MFTIVAAKRSGTLLCSSPKRDKSQVTSCSLLQPDDSIVTRKAIFLSGRTMFSDISNLPAGKPSRHIVRLFDNTACSILCHLQKCEISRLLNISHLIITHHELWFALLATSVPPNKLIPRTLLVFLNVDGCALPAPMSNIVWCNDAKILLAANAISDWYLFEIGSVNMSERQWAVEKGLALIENFDLGGKTK